MEILNSKCNSAAVLCPLHLVYLDLSLTCSTLRPGNKSISLYFPYWDPSSFFYLLKFSANPKNFKKGWKLEVGHFKGWELYITCSILVASYGTNLLNCLSTKYFLFLFFFCTSLSSECWKGLIAFYKSFSVKIINIKCGVLLLEEEDGMLASKELGKL